jgi:hypothetical protein
MRPISLMIVATASPAHAGLAGAHPITHSNDDAQLKGGVQDFARNPSTHQPLLSIVKRYANANAHDKGDTTSSVDVAQCRKDALAEGLSASSIANACAPRQSGGDSLLANHEFYEKHLPPLRSRHLNILLIGVFRGESVAVWSDYFVHATLVCVDINLHPARQFRPSLLERGAFKRQNSRYFVADSTNITSWAASVQKLPLLGGPFDVVSSRRCWSGGAAVHGARRTLA